MGNNDELEKMGTRLELLVFEKGELEGKFRDCEKEVKRLREENAKMVGRLSQCLGSDEVEQLRLSIAELQEKLYHKSKESQSLGADMVRMRQS